MDEMSETRSASHEMVKSDSYASIRPGVKCQEALCEHLDE